MVKKETMGESAQRLFNVSEDKRVRTDNMRGPEPIFVASSGLLRKVISPLNMVVYDMLNKRF